MIELPARARSLKLEVSDGEPARGWRKLYVGHVQQAHRGADLDCLVGASVAGIPRDSD